MIPAIVLCIFFWGHVLSDTSMQAPWWQHGIVIGLWVWLFRCLR